MDVTLQYLDGCPNWHEAEARLREALRRVGQSHTALSFQPVSTAEEAERLRFRGSPTILVDGSDPFADDAAPVGLSCRIFNTPEGLRGTPTVEQLVLALR